MKRRTTNKQHRDQHAVLVRMPKDLHERVKEAARDDDRSVVAFIRTTLEDRVAA